MKNRGTFGGGNGGLWMIGKRRKVVELSVNNNDNNNSNDHDHGREADSPAQLAVAPCCVEIPGHGNNSEPPDATDDSFFQLDDDVEEAVSPVKVTAQKFVIATTHRKKPTRRSNWGGTKRGTFGSRQRNLLTDSEISKKIRVALSQSSVSQVSSSDDDDETGRTSPQRRKLVVDSSDGDDGQDDDDDSSIASKRQTKDKEHSSQESLESNLTFQDDASCHRSEALLHPSLAAARSFFAELDDVSLTMEDASRNPSAKKNYKLRTRRCKLPASAFQSEYAKYCAACVESGVKPLSIQHFAEQRARYFRQSEVFDGMFDE
jgi:hypothetical protein